jgi:hypothetical protein
MMFKPAVGDPVRDWARRAFALPVRTDRSDASPSHRVLASVLNVELRELLPTVPRTVIEMGSAGLDPYNAVSIPT